MSSSSKKYKATVAAVKSDDVLKEIARTIYSMNIAGTPAPFLKSVFRDRIDELCLYVPNEAYYSVFLGIAIAAGKLK